MKQEIDNILCAVRQAVELCGFSQTVQIVMATKTQEPSTIAQAIGYGLTIAGENRVQELLSKYDSDCLKGTEWHFIGRLQCNKVKYIVDKVSLIQSVDSLKLAQEIDKRSIAVGKVMPILVQVNFGNEPQKGGIAPDSLDQLLDSIDRLEHITIKGLMTVMPQNAEDRLYVEARSCFDRIKEARRARGEFDTLSMGMSDDYLTAVRYGSTMIRIGRNIFGDRK